MLKDETLDAIDRAVKYQPPERISTPTEADDAVDAHRNAPVPDRACLYGLIGDIANAGADTTEANPYAIALNAIAYISAAVGRGPYMPVGNTWHHARIFGKHVGRTGRGRKGDATSLVTRIDMALRLRDKFIAPQVHRGGLSSREGLALLIHDGFKEGKNEVEAIHDKRLWVLESEFSNILQQGKRDGNTLSSALRDAWDGVSIKPATKSNRVWASDPHIAISGAITPNELRALMASRELTNGFANRFLSIWAERTKILPFPQATPQTVVDSLAARVDAVLRFAGADRPVDRDVLRMSLSDDAQQHYARLYLKELNDQSNGELVNALLERRAPMLLRLSMLFALCDETAEIGLGHIKAAMSWVNYWRDSVKFIFATADDETTNAETNEAATKIIEFLTRNSKATRWELTRDCFGNHLSRDRLDAAIDELLLASPPAIVVETVPRPKSKPGAPTKSYSLAAKSAKSAKSEHSCGFADDFDPGEVCEVSEVRSEGATRLRTLRTLRNDEKTLKSRASIDTSHTSHTSHGDNETEVIL
jgi:hypothetical protein